MGVDGLVNLTSIRGGTTRPQPRTTILILDASMSEVDGFGEGADCVFSSSLRLVSMNSMRFWTLAVMDDDIVLK